MDERKPTYKELLEENQNHRQHNRFNNVYFSVLTCLVVFMGYAIIALFARYGLAMYLIEINAHESWGIFALSCLHFASIAIGLYIIWHFIFVWLYNYEDEVDNFIEHWRKTKESIREENKQQFNPPE